MSKKNVKHRRIFLLLLSLLVIFSGLIFQVKTEAVVVPKLTQVGPINESNGFPLWYKDSNGTKQELCLDLNNAICGLVTEDFNPDLPISFPKNYPGEAFYQLAEASMETRDGRGDAIGVFALEATFNGEVPKVGDQTVFGRIRLRIDNLTAGKTYKITHPYGVDEIIAESGGKINYTEDIGAGQGFDGALSSRIGTFLKWDPAVAPAAPAGYVGDPNIAHKVTGGVNNQNFFRIEGPGIGLSYPANACSTNPNNCIETDLFSLAGKIAVNNGLDIQQATYSQSAKGGAIDVFVSSEIEQAIEVSGAGIETTSLAGGNGQYYAHVPYTGAEPPAEVTLTNVDDTPDTLKTITLADRITASANYDTANKTFTITAKSSDEVDPPKLTVKGFGDINPEIGTLVISDLSYIPPTITITSSINGTVTIPVNINDTPVVAVAGTDQSVIIGEQAQITLDGSKSTGPIETYLWEPLPSNPTDISLSGATTPTATFDTPTTPGVYQFQLTVTGPGGPATSTVKVTIVNSEPDPDPDPAPTANAGPDQKDVKQGTVVTLDGSGSENATTYSWEQTGGPTVSLNGANAAKPTFTFPKQPQPVTFELTVTGPNGTDKDTVTISPASDTLTVSRAEYNSRRGGSWRIDGKSDVFGPGVRVTIKIVDSANPDGVQLGTADVNPSGNWDFQQASDLAIGAGRTLLIESSSGGKLTNVSVRIKD